MSTLSSRERCARRAEGKARNLVSFGSPAILNLRTNPEVQEVNSIAAIEALARRHMPLLKAKRAVEAALLSGSHGVHRPRVEDPETLRRELGRAGFLAKVAPLHRAAVDVKRLRERLGYSQEQFAARYPISVDVLQNWEQHRNEPDAIANNLLQMIEHAPAEVERILWEMTAG